MTDATSIPDAPHPATSRTALAVVAMACATAGTAYARRGTGGYVGAPTLRVDHADILATLIRQLPDGPGLVEGVELQDPVPGSEGLYWVVEEPTDASRELAVMLVQFPAGSDEGTPTLPHILSFYVHPVALRRSMGAASPCYWSSASGVRCVHHDSLPSGPLDDPVKLGVHADLARRLLERAAAALDAEQASTS